MRDKDFIYQDLFKTRKELMEYVFQYRKWDLLKIAFLTIPFTALFFIWTIYSRYHFMNQSDIITYLMVNAFPGLFLSFLLGVGLSGSFYTIRRLIFGDTVKISYHFFKGIKESGFESGFFASIFYILYVLLDLLDKVVFTNGSPIWPFVSIIIFIIDAFLMYILYLTYVSCTLYVVSFTRAVKDAFMLLLDNPLSTIKSFIFACFPILLLYPYMYFGFTLYINIVGAVLFVLYTAFFGIFLNVSSIYDQFDVLVNKNEYPAFYKKGLYKGEEK